MMNIATTKVSARGQIVIPLEMRGEIKEGDKLLIMQKDNQFTMKKMSEIDKKMEEDIEFSRRTRKAQESCDKGEMIEMDFDDLIKEMRSW